MSGAPQRPPFVVALLVGLVCLLGPVLFGVALGLCAWAVLRELGLS